jgi:CheY-like chemotaxis protein
VATRPTSPVILVVEDDLALRKLFLSVLDIAGYQTVGASDADEALRLLSGQCEPDLLLTDIRMPGSLNGIELARKVRESRPALPIVFVSGFTKETVPVSLGEFLHKPVLPSDLRAAVSRALEA